MKIKRQVGQIVVKLPAGSRPIATRPLASKAISQYPIIFLDQRSGEYIGWTPAMDFSRADALKRQFNKEWGCREWQ